MYTFLSTYTCDNFLYIDQSIYIYTSDSLYINIYYILYLVHFHMHTTSKKQYLERSFNILSSPVPFITKLYGEWLVTCLRIVNTKMNGFSKLQHTSSGIYHGISNMSILSHYIVNSHQQVLGYIMLNPYEIPVGESPPFPWIPLRTSSKATICRPTSSGWKNHHIYIEMRSTQDLK